MPVGQSCLTAIADIVSVPLDIAVDRHPRSQPDEASATKAMYKRGMRFSTFEEFWPFYVREHSKKSTRTIHFVGTTAVMGLVAYAAARRKVWPLLVAPVVGYGPAWFSHYFIEGNKPATFKYPLWSLRADFVMWSKIARGTMDAEIERITHDEAARTNGDAAHAPS